MTTELLDPIWCAEFRGFFWGEGYIGISSWGVHPNGHIKMQPRLQIAIRDDDADVLRDVQSKLGGTLAYQLNDRYMKNCNPICIWRVTRKDQIEGVLDVLDGGVLPAKKRLQIAILREYLATMLPPGYRVPEATYIKREQLHRQLKEFHAYQTS